jgi:biofilm PGA synthesis N-glycosyltransferase PgaC
MIWALLFWVGAAVVFVSYVGYGAWVAGLARIRPRRSLARYRADDALPRVTCVMAAANEAARIEGKLEALVQQDYPTDKLAIIVVSDASTDGTDERVADRAARDSRIRLLRAPERRGKPTALNLARPEIVTEIAVFMDVRQGLTKRTIRELVAHLEDPEVGVVSGDLRVAGDAYWTYEGYVRKCESRSGSMVQVTGSLYAIRTRDIPVIPADTILDDVYVPLRVAMTGRRIVMAEEAGSLDVVTRSVGSEFIRKVRTLAGLIQICHSVPGCLRPGTNPVWGRFVIHKLSRLACPYGLFLVAAGSWMADGLMYRAALVAMLAVGALALARKLGVRSRLTSLSQALVALNVAALSALPAYYFGWASVTWARVEVDRS